MKINMNLFFTMFLSMAINSANRATNALTIENNLDKTVRFKVSLHCPDSACFLPTKNVSCQKYSREIGVASGNYVGLPGLHCQDKKEKLKYKIDFFPIEKLPTGTRLTISASGIEPTAAATNW